MIDTHKINQDCVVKMVDLRIEELKKRVIGSINSCKQYGTRDAHMMVLAYQNVLRMIELNRMEFKYD